MKIIIFSVDHVYANFLVKKIIGKYKTDINLIVESDVILNNRSSINALQRYIKVSGLYYVLAQVVKLKIYKYMKYVAVNFLAQENKFYPFNKVAQMHDIKIIKAKNVNTESFERKIKKIAPDLIISVLFNQILKSNVIRIPKSGVINIHPAYLPDYKGMSPVFWSLANKEKFSGISVHYINEGIDTGGIITRKRIKISKNDSEDSLYWRSVVDGVEILFKAINLIQNKRVKTIANTGGRYFSLPSTKAVTTFRKNKRKFFDLREYLFSR